MIILSFYIRPRTGNEITDISLGSSDDIPSLTASTPEGYTVMNAYDTSSRRRFFIRATSALACVLLGLAAFSGLDVLVRTYVFGQHSSASTQQKPAPRTVALREDDLVIRTVTENGIKLKRTYAPDFDGTLVNVGIPTPLVNSGLIGDDSTATVNNLCTAVYKVNADSRSDHPDRDTMKLKATCNSAKAALFHGNTKECKTSLVKLGALILDRVNDKRVLDDSFTNGNINDACGDKKGSSMASASGTYYLPAIAVNTGM